MTRTTPPLSSYLSASVHRRLAARDLDPRHPAVDDVTATVLFADISGFTALTEQLASQGRGGAEAMTRILNRYFDRFIEVIAAHGGDVLTFAGDALLATWPATPERSLSAQAAITLACAHALQANIVALRTETRTPLRLKVGIGAGDLRQLLVGGVAGKWEVLIAGKPLADLAVAMHAAQPGDVVQTPAIRALLPQSPASPLLDSPATVPDTPLTDAPVSVFEGFLPEAVLARVAAQQADWLAELRPVTVLFAKLPDLAAHPPEAHALIQDVQRIVARYEGTLNKLSVDEKGTSVIVAFGLPPHAHEDDPARGALAALALQDLLTCRGLPSAIGLSTGVAYCGEVGNARRREYTLIGDAVNLAARLMQAASGDVRCDRAVALAAHGRVEFEPVGEITVKGKAESIQVFRPTAMIKERRADHAPLIGRHAERMLLAEHIGRLAAEGTGAVILLEAEAGMGKSRLVAETLRLAAEQDVPALLGSGDAIERNTPYHAVQGLLNQLLLQPEATGPDPAAAFRRLVADQDDLEPLLPLLNDVLSLGLSENDLTSQMSGQVRADNTRALVVQLLKRAMEGRPHVLILEDVHWVDSASLGIVALACKLLPSVLFVLATRPLPDGMSLEWTTIARGPETLRLELGALAPEEVFQLISSRLGVRELPEPVRRLISAKAEGHPFYSEELAYALRDTGALEIREGNCHLLQPERELADLDLPSTVQGVITSRVDRLQPSAQLTLKVASVIGRSFALESLRAVHPVSAAPSALLADLDTLERLDITPLEAGDTYLFKHAITQEVVYNLMAFDQRRSLHRTVAERLEREHESDLASHMPLLAHHWSLAEDAGKAVDYLTRAGERALQGGAYREATEFLLRALAIDSPDAPLALARRHRSLGEAYFGLGDLEKTRLHLERSIEILGFGAARRPMDLLGSLGAQLLVQAGHVLLGTPRPRGPSEASSTRLEAARSFERLGPLYLFMNRAPLTLRACLTSLNLVEGEGESPELARGYANMGVAAGLLALHPLAESYLGKALGVLPAIDDQPAIAWVKMIVGFCGLGTGRWDRAGRLIPEAREIAERLGDVRRRDECTILQGHHAYFEGRLAEAHEAFEQTARSAERRQDQHVLAGALTGMAQVALRQDSLDEAEGWVDQARESLASQESVGEAIWALSVSAVLSLRQGRSLEALERANVASARMKAVQPTACFQLEGYAGVVEVYVSLLAAARRDETPGDRRTLRRESRDALGRFEAFCRSFPIGKPRYHYWQGRLATVLGNRHQAHVAWRQGLVESQRLSMPHEQALLHAAMGLAAEHA